MDLFLLHVGIKLRCVTGGRAWADVFEAGLGSGLCYAQVPDGVANAKRNSIQRWKILYECNCHVRLLFFFPFIS